MIEFDYVDGEVVASPTVIVSGTVIGDVGVGFVKFISKYEILTFPVIDSKFKAIVNLANNSITCFTVEIYNNNNKHNKNNNNNNNININDININDININDGDINNDDGDICIPIVTQELRLQYRDFDRKPIHLCLIVASDSQGQYDIPAYRLNRGEVANIDTAIAKLQVVGRLMQAYTHHEMRSANFGNRCFKFVEQSTKNDNNDNNDNDDGIKTIKIHCLRSNKTMAQIQDINWAQQNKNATDNGGLFSHAIDLIKQSPLYKNNDTAIQAACIYLDTKWDKQLNLILGHAALGGGSDDVKLAIFGSHGIHSWPSTFNQVIPAFLDDTKLSIDEVANDNGDCDTSCQTFNLTAGAFLHEIGHLLGCPHQNSGVMLRDYPRWYKSFVSKPLNDSVPICHWHHLDLVRFLYHDSFSLSGDNFNKVYSTTLKPNDFYENKISPSIFHNKDGVLLKSTSGIYLVEVCIGELAKYYLEYLPQDCGPTDVVQLNYDQIVEVMNSLGFNDQKLIIRILSIGGDKQIDDFSQFVIPSNNPAESFMVTSDFGLGKGELIAYKSELLGRNVNKYQIIGLDLKIVDKIRVYHGMAIDGIRFCNTKSDSNNIFEKMFVKLDSSMMFGNQTNYYSDFELYPDEYIIKFHVKSGWWVDGIQFETSTGRKSPWYGKDSGSVSVLECPTETSTIVGIYGFVGEWLDGIGIVYTEE